MTDKPRDFERVAQTMLSEYGEGGGTRHGHRIKMEIVRLLACDAWIRDLVDDANANATLDVYKVTKRRIDAARAAIKETPC